MNKKLICAKYIQLYFFNSSSVSKMKEKREFLPYFSFSVAFVLVSCCTACLRFKSASRQNLQQKLSQRREFRKYQKTIIVFSQKWQNISVIFRISIDKRKTDFTIIRVSEVRSFNKLLGFNQIQKIVSQQCLFVRIKLDHF